MLGRIVGVCWLFFACVLLASFGAIMTSSVTTDTVSISGKKASHSYSGSQLLIQRNPTLNGRALHHSRIKLITNFDYIMNSLKVSHNMPACDAKSLPMILFTNATLFHPDMLITLEVFIACIFFNFTRPHSCIQVMLEMLQKQPFRLSKKTYLRSFPGISNHSII